ncbi:SurA N-terminal domain-containing protein [Pseudomonadota bacterium]|nr:SurA N-terminal domain-containing protein [Alphaproteobacteria bacterium]MDC1357243.1 SurA N-terminal domain-containing protein [Pseudomonadota bacterium]
MLRALRNQTQSIFFKIFLGFLICGFALWGVGDLTGGINKKPVLSVENQEINIEEVILELNKLRYSSPQRPSLKETVKNGMLRNVLNKFEQEILINKEADFLNLYVPLTLQTKTIRQEESFKNPLGKFSENKYLQSLNNAGLTEKKYLEMIKTEANFKQLSMPFQANDFYSNDIIKSIIDWQNEVRNIEFETLNYVDKNDIKEPSTNTLKNFYKENKSLYAFPKTRDIKYIEITPSNFQDEIKISNKQINDRYEIDKSLYVTEEKRRIFQVTSQNKLKIEQFKKLLNKGNNFEIAAKKIFNLTKQDINIGLISKSELPNKSANTLFSKKVNDIIGPIKTEFGYNIYKIVNIIPKNEIKYKEAIKDIEKKILNEMSIDIFYEKLDLIEDLIAEGNTLEEISQSDVFNKLISIKKLNKISEDSFLYSYTNNKTYLNKGRDFLKKIWNTNLNQISDLINIKGDKYALLQVEKENIKENLNFEKVKNKILDQWTDIEILNQTKLKLKRSILSNKQKLKSSSIIRRNQQYLNDIKDNSLIFKIFEINNKEINFLNTIDGVVAAKIINRKVDDYKINNEINDKLNLSLSNSFFNDFSNYYVNNLAIKHKLVRNYLDLERFLLNAETQ